MLHFNLMHLFQVISKILMCTQEMQLKIHIFSADDDARHY